MMAGASRCWQKAPTRHLQGPFSALKAENVKISVDFIDHPLLHQKAPTRHLQGPFSALKAENVKISVGFLDHPLLHQ